jgi:hypothetical protein
VLFECFCCGVEKTQGALQDTEEEGVRRLRWKVKTRMSGGELLRNIPASVDKCQCPLRGRRMNFSCRSEICGILTMACNTQDHWILGLCTSTSILKTRKRSGSETGFSSFLRWKRKTLCLLDLLERASLNRFLRDPTKSVSPSPHLRTETDPVSETLCFLVFRIEVENPVILTVITATRYTNKKRNSVVWVREQTIPTERQTLVGEVSANCYG